MWSIIGCDTEPIDTTDLPLGEPCRPTIRTPSGSTDSAARFLSSRAGSQPLAGPSTERQHTSTAPNGEPAPGLMEAWSRPGRTMQNGISLPPVDPVPADQGSLVSRSGVTRLSSYGSTMSDPSLNSTPRDIERSERTVTEAVAAPVTSDAALNHHG